MAVRLPSFERDLARAATLPSSAYTDPEFLAAEHTEIFRRTWQPLVRLEDVAANGSFATGEIAGAPVVVTRDTDGTLRGFYNVCRHRAGPVAGGKGARRSLTCRYHGWTYGLDGALRTTPEIGEPKNFDPSCFGLRGIEIATFGPLVFGALEPRAPFSTTYAALAEKTKAYGIDSMRFVGRKEYVLRCNWKVYVDNFMEGYHLPTVHPDLFKTLDYDRYVVETEGEHVMQYAPHRDGSGEARYFWAFPNVMFNFYGGRLEVDLVLPLGVDRTLTIFEWYFPTSIAGAELERAQRSLEESDAIQGEDISICETVQKNLASGGFGHGRFSTTRENGVHHFQSLVHQWLATR